MQNNVEHEEKERILMVDINFNGIFKRRHFNIICNLTLRIRNWWYAFKRLNETNFSTIKPKYLYLKLSHLIYHVYQSVIKSDIYASAAIVVVI